MEQGIKSHISEVLKEERTKKGNSQEKLAEYCGVSKSAVSKWEQGEPWQQHASRHGAGGPKIYILIQS